MNSRCLLLKGKDYFPVRTMFGEKKRRRIRSRTSERPFAAIYKPLWDSALNRPARDRRTDNNFTGMWLIAFVAIEPCVNRVFFISARLNGTLSSARHPERGRRNSLQLAPHVEYIPRILAVTAAQTLE